MQITLDLLRANGACEDGVNAFLGQYPDGLADYQDVLNKCVEHDLERYAAWLLNAVGPTMDVLRIEGDLITDKSIYICGSLYVTGSINAGENINAGWGINAGWDINAGRGIDAGRNYGIYAGLHARLDDIANRSIRAAHKPERIMTGVWVDD